MRVSIILIGLGLALGVLLLAADASAMCGDGLLDPNSECCDDGNVVSGDGCNDDCTCPTDHLKCYKIRDRLNFSSIVDLDSPQFGLEAGCTIIRAKKFCVPVTKTIKVLVAPPGAEEISGGELLDDYICYKIRCRGPVPPDPKVIDQFGSRTVRMVRAFELCTPAKKCPPTQSVIISTGVSGAVGAADPLWTLATAPSNLTGPTPPRPATITTPHTQWGECLRPGSPSQWISADGNACFAPDCPDGDYTYQLCWTQCGSTTVAFDALADNTAEVFLDGTMLTPPLLNFTNPTSFSATAAGSGTHFLEVDVTNDLAALNATGMNLCGSITGSFVEFVPCPPCEQSAPSCGGECPFPQACITDPIQGCVCEGVPPPGN